MKNTSIRCRPGAYTLGAIGLLLAAISLAGCTGQGTPAQAGEKASAAKEPAAVAAPAGVKQAEAAKPKTAPKEAGDTVKVGACDGGAAVEVSKGLTGQALADELMDQWKRSHPEANWVAEEKERHAFQPPADNSGLLKGGQGKGDAYGNFTQRDILTWTRETEKFVAEGSRIFHSGDELGSAVGVSCDMCHPHAANTHPETYPKFQVQLGRVVLLRDMINWCVENPVRAKDLDPDGAKMRALEAYIQAQRKGVPMNYGKH
jgi:thiosulfate dehydrogenase